MTAAQFQQTPTYLEASPIAGMPRLRQVGIRKRVLEPEEETRLLAQLRPQDQALYIAGVDTLVRLGDLLDLQRADDHGTWLQLVDSKTGPYQVPVSARLRQALDGLPADGPLPDDHQFYFWWRRRAKSERDRRGAVRQLLARACARLHAADPLRSGDGRDHVAYRHPGNWRDADAAPGVDPATVQAIGHWASLDQMGDYLQTTTALAAAAVNLIDPAAKLPAPPAQLSP